VVVGRDTCASFGEIWLALPLYTYPLYTLYPPLPFVSPLPTRILGYVYRGDNAVTEIFPEKI